VEREAPLERTRSNTAPRARSQGVNPILAGLADNRRRLAKADKAWGQRALSGERPQFAFAILLAAAEFLIGAASAVNTAANEQQMLDKLSSIQNGISAIQAQLADIEAKLDDIIELLQDLLPAIQSIVDASNYKNTVLDYIGKCNTARQNIQTYMPADNPVLASQHTQDVLDALKTLQNAVNVIVSAGAGAASGLDVAATIFPPFSLWLNAWDMNQALIAAATTNYQVVRARDHKLFTDMRVWIDAFFKQCSDAKVVATDIVGGTACPLPNDSPTDYYELNGSTFVRRQGLAIELFRWDSFQIGCQLQIAQFEPRTPNNLSWKAAVVLSGPGIATENSALSNPALGLAGYKACRSIQARLQSCHSTLDALGDVDTIHAQVTAALDLV
jgi:hypothetical protein